MKNKEFDFFAEKIFDPFITRFDNACNYYDNSQKEEILGSFDEIFYKWYNSPYFRGTVLTPCKLIEQYLANTACDEDNVRLSLKRMYSKKIDCFRTQKNNYSYENHAIIKDIKLFVKSAELYSVYGISSLKGIRNRFSIFTEDYIQFLYEICLRLNFFDKLKSIYTKNDVYIPNNSIKELNDSMLADLVYHTASEICCDRLNSLLIDIDTKLKERFPGANDYTIVFDRAFDESVLYEVLRRDAVVYEIQVSMLDVFDIDINNILYKSKNVLSDDERFFIELFNMLGKKIEKYFVIPFSCYLNFFIPFYIEKFDIERCLREFLYNKKFGDNSLLEYKTCARIQLTELGKEFFDIIAEDEYKDKFSTLEPYEILNFLANDFEKSDDNKNRANIIKLSVRSEDDNAVEIEISKNSTLEKLQMEICVRFFEPMNVMYSFFAGIESPFLEFPSAITNKRIPVEKAAYNCKIYSLFKTGNESAILILKCDDGIKRYTIENISSKSMRSAEGKKTAVIDNNDNDCKM